MSNVLRFSSRSLASERTPPRRQGIEIFWSDGAVRDEEDAFEDFSPRQLRVYRALNAADKPLIHADLMRDPRLRPSIPLAPVRELHAGQKSQSATNTGQSYATPSYLVNGHGDSKGAEYAAVAYILVMHPGNRIRELRKAAGLTQERLAEVTGYAQDRISNYENGRRPMRLVEMRVLARGLGCAVADLLDDSDNPERLSAAEKKLLNAFRQSPADARDFLLTSAQAVADKQSPSIDKSSAAA